MDEGGIGARASYVAVVVVVVGVDASLIPVNGLLGLNRRGAFLWAGSIIHSLHSCLRGSGGGSGIHWHGINAADSLPLPSSFSRHPRASLFLLAGGKSHQTKLGSDPGFLCSAGFHVGLIRVSHPNRQQA